MSHVPVPSGAAQGPRITYEFVQHVEYLAKGRSLCSLPLPAVQHQLVQHHRTVHWSGQTVALFYGFDHLEDGHKTGAGEAGVVFRTCWMHKSRLIYAAFLWGTLDFLAIDYTQVKLQMYKDALHDKKTKKSHSFPI